MKNMMVVDEKTDLVWNGETDTLVCIINIKKNELLLDNVMHIIDTKLECAKMSILDRIEQLKDKVWLT